MLVGKGALSFRAFRVSGKNPTPSHAKVTELLEQLSFAGIDSGHEGSVEGWIGPNHLFDGDFDEAKIFRGRYAVFAFRVDTRKVPGALLAAHTAVAIEAELEAEGLEKIPARRKREIKLEIKQQLLTETPPVQRAYGVFWNIHNRRVCLQGTSKSVVEAFRALFERTFGLTLEPQAPGLVAAAYAREHGRMEELKEARPLRLIEKTQNEPALAGAGV